ncbi:MAG: hypothetical protein FWG21_00740 [Oscillospiraceae bacterium]|nr:hypothetical protein [Oscillospiraceae bacterium]
MQSISFYDQYPTVDTLPVMKGRYFNDQTKLLYHVKAACIKDVGFLYDLTKFEQNPVVEDTTRLGNTDSLVAVSFNYSGQAGDDTITVIMNAVGRNIVLVNDNPYSTLSDVATYMGNDEQGWYWGVRFLLPYEILEHVYDNIVLQPGNQITGNIYASLRNSRHEHFVSVAPFYTHNMSDMKNHIDFMVLL